MQGGGKKRTRYTMTKSRVNCIVITREQEFLIKYIGVNCGKFIEKFHSMANGRKCTYSLMKVQRSTSRVNRSLLTVTRCNTILFVKPSTNARTLIFTTIHVYLFHTSTRNNRTRIPFQLLSSPRLCINTRVEINIRYSLPISTHVKKIKIRCIENNFSATCLHNHATRVPVKYNTYFASSTLLRIG